MNFPDIIPNWINGVESPADSGKTFIKLSPANGKELFQVSRSNAKDVSIAVESCKVAYSQWSANPPVKRGLILHDIVIGMIKQKEEI